MLQGSKEEILLVVHDNPPRELGQYNSQRCRNRLKGNANGITNCKFGLAFVLILVGTTAAFSGLLNLTAAALYGFDELSMGFEEVFLVDTGLYTRSKALHEPFVPQAQVRNRYY